mgnify:CR=1 FL=1
MTVLHSDKRFYQVEGMPTTEAGIDTNLWRDLYLVLGDPAPGGGWAVRLYFNPLVLWIWGGAGLMALGGLIGSFTGLGIPTEAAKEYEAAVREGGVVVAAKAANADDEKRITSVLQQHGPRTVHSYTQAL